MHKIYLPILLVLFFCGCALTQKTTGDLKTVWYGYHQTLVAVQHEIVTAYIDGKIDKSTRDKLYAIGDRAVDADNLAKKMLKDLEEGKTTQELVVVHMQNFTQLVFDLVGLAKNFGLKVKVQ
ncbi:MAG: hypothetical protein QMD05_11140 [Candidatus Brocadiaceae bacterium]|nr:hypothetical protein [Candidatus Brocadiaceae bacterium]